MSLQSVKQVFSQKRLWATGGGQTHVLSPDSGHFRPHQDAQNGSKVGSKLVKNNPFPRIAQDIGDPKLEVTGWFRFSSLLFILYYMLCLWLALLGFLFFAWNWDFQMLRKKVTGRLVG